MTDAIGLGVFMLLAAWMVLAAALAGVLLRGTHYEVVGTRTFALLRRYGIRGALRSRSVLLLARKRLRSQYFRRIAASLVLIPTTGAIAGASFPAAAWLAIPDTAKTREILHALDVAGTTLAACGAGLAVWVWLRGLTYVTKPRPMDSRSPEYTSALELTRRGLDRLLVNTYWYRRIKSAGVIASAYPFCLLTLIASALPPPAESTSDDSTNIKIIGLLALVAPMIAAIALTSRVQRRLVAVRAANEICLFLEQDKAPQAQSFPDTIPDPLGARRVDLTRISGLLGEAAAQLDLRQPRGFAPHPIASVLRATAEEIRGFLRKPDSVVAAAPTTLHETLRLTVLVLVEADNTSAFEELATRTNAFDDGTPTAETFVRPPGRFEALYTRATSSIQRLAASLAALGTVAAIAIAVGLALIGRTDLAELLGSLK